MTRPGRSTGFRAPTYRGGGAVRAAVRPASNDQSAVIWRGDLSQTPGPWGGYGATYPPFAIAARSTRRERAEQWRREQGRCGGRAGGFRGGRRLLEQNCSVGESSRSPGGRWEERRRLIPYSP